MKFGRRGGRIYKGDVEVVYLCPNSECDELFIGYFEPLQNQGHLLIGSRPIEPTGIKFEDSVLNISPTFCEIYQEAHKAEQLGLTQICGVGYRKAVEFLVKDYLVTNRPEGEVAIKKMMLGPCIAEFVEDQWIKEVAKRAVWLGNDETHYQRRWVDKDITDLKTMIRLTVHWIEAEALTAEALKSMPDPNMGADAPQ
jgi:hypothetical protein